MPAHVRQQNGAFVVQEAPRTLPVSANVDVIVLGGGVAGMAAALAAAEGGGSVLLIVRGNCLGGTATAGMMALFYTPYRCAHGIPKRIFDRLIAAGGAFPGEIISFDHEVFKSVAFEMVAEAGVDILLHTICADVIMDGGRVHGLVIENKGGRSAVLGRVLIDASGDADIAARAGSDAVAGAATAAGCKAASGRAGGVCLKTPSEHAAIPPPSRSENKLAWIISPARPIACRWRGCRWRVRRWMPADRTARPDPRPGRRG